MLFQLFFFQNIHENKENGAGFVGRGGRGARVVNPPKVESDYDHNIVLHYILLIVRFVLTTVKVKFLRVYRMTEECLINYL